MAKRSASHPPVAETTRGAGIGRDGIAELDRHPGGRHPPDGRGRVEVLSPHDGVGTVLSAAVPLDRPVIDARRALGTAKAMTLAGRRGAAAERSETGRNKGGKLARANASLQRSELEQKVQRAERRELLLDSARVQVTGVCHAGVVVEIGEVRLVLDQDQRGVHFSFDRETRELRMERPAK